MSQGEATEESLRRIREALRSHLPEKKTTGRSTTHPGELVDEAEFWLRVNEEIERSDLSGSPFAVFVVKARQANEDASSALVGAVRPALIRACDCFALFSDEPAIGVLLPETEGTGADVVLERFRSLIGTGEQLDIWMAEYPADGGKLTNFMAQAA